MNDEELKQIVQAASREKDGKTTLRCARAFALANAHSVPLHDIGRVCNRAGIRITACQLGCFE